MVPPPISSTSYLLHAGPRSGIPGASPAPAQPRTAASSNGCSLPGAISGVAGTPGAAPRTLPSISGGPGTPTSPGAPPEALPALQHAASGTPGVPGASPGASPTLPRLLPRVPPLPRQPDTSVQDSHCWCIPGVLGSLPSLPLRRRSLEVLSPCARSPISTP